MYLFVPQELKKRIRKDAHASIIDGVLNDLEPKLLPINRSCDLPLAGVRSDGPYYKVKEQMLRLVFMVRQIAVAEKSTWVFCLAAIFRHDNQYHEYLQDRRTYGNKNFEHLISENEIGEFVRERLADDDTITALPRVPDSLLPWLEPPSFSSEASLEDLVVYESEEWVEMAARQEAIERRSVFWDLVKDLEAIHRNEKNLSEIDRPDIKVVNSGDCFVYYARVTTCDPAPRRILFLIAPFSKRPDRETLINLINKACPTADKLSGGDLSWTWLARFAKRAYPHYMLLDQEAWFDIQREKESNLALSPEEEEVLRSLSQQPTAEAAGLPAFLNGRAGSGKSTMLFYLFADYCFRKILKPDLPGTPLFLTYSKLLCDAARDSVNRILSCHHKYREQTSPSADKASYRKMINECFQDFQSFLRESLRGNTERRFLPEKRITFVRFRQMLAESKLKKSHRISPEMAWHVIRTFIKGYSAIGFMTREDYAEIPAKDAATVDQETFAFIFDTIWKQWYLPLTSVSEDGDGWWDDLDLAREALIHSDSVLKKENSWPVIFCDEAQDFTRVELQLILKLSTWSGYDLGFNFKPHLPCAFAGDPFQTLNPTGFRWESVRATFLEEVLRMLDPEDRLGLGLSFKELKLNYRSSPSIVRTTNLIQFMRHILFDHKNLEPQQAWQSYEDAAPRKFLLGQNLSADQLKEHLSDTNIIVPCESDEILDFIKADPVLTAVFPDAAKGTVPKEIMTATQAKGLEFNRVVLYKFGEACPPDIWSEGRSPKDPGQRMSIEFYFNKLYVAISRARKYLFVIDTPEGDAKLWKLAEDRNSLDKLRKRASKPEIWEEFEVISHGRVKDLQEFKVDDKINEARQFENAGKRDEDPDMMERAAGWYRSASWNEEEKECRAWAMKFRHEYLKAGQAFLRLKMEEPAWNCFWSGMHWSEMVAMGQQNPQRGGPELRIASLMANSQASIEMFTDFLDDRARKNAIGFADSPQWLAFSDRLKTLATSALSDPNTSSATFQKLASSIVNLAEKNFPGMRELAADCYAKAELYKDAVRWYEKAGMQKTQKYFRAKGRAEGIPAGLIWFQRANDYDEILAAWENAGGQAEKYLFRTADARKGTEVLKKLRNGNNEFWSSLHKSFNRSLISEILDWNPDAPPDAPGHRTNTWKIATAKSVIREFNRLIESNVSIYKPSHKDAIKLRNAAMDIYHRRPLGADLKLLNRWIIEDAFGDCLPRVAKIPAAHDQEWLRPVGIALEQRQRWSDAFLIQYSLEEWDTAISYYRKMHSSQKDIIDWNAFRTLVLGMVHQNQILHAIDLLREFGEKFSIREEDSLYLTAQVIEKIAKMPPRKYTSDESLRIKQAIAGFYQKPGAINHCKIEDIGRSLSLIDSRAAELSFYAEMADHPSSEVNGTARREWLYVAYQEWKSARTPGRINDQQLIYSELRKRLQTWSVQTDSLPDDFWKDIMPERCRVRFRVSPETIKVNQTGPEKPATFSLAHLDFRLLPAPGILQITENEELRGIRLVSETGEITGENLEIHEIPENLMQKGFVWKIGRLRGIMTQNSEATTIELFLDLNDWKNKPVRIEFLKSVEKPAEMQAAY